MIYIINKDTLSIKDIVQSISDNVIQSIDLKGKSVFTISTPLTIVAGDFIVQKNDIKTKKELMRERKNLFDNTTVTTGFLNATTGKHEIFPTYPDSRYSGQIKVIGGAPYCISGTNKDLRYRVYNLDGSYLKSESIVSNVPYIPGVDCYIKPLFFNGLTEIELNSIQIEVGSSPTRYESFISSNDKIGITYQGIISTVETIKQNKIYKIYSNELPSIFDRKILLTDSELIASIGVEDFIDKTIKDKFTNSLDSFLNITYVDTIIGSHTPMDIEVENQDSIYNFMDFLGVVKEKYGITLNFEFLNSRLVTTILKRELSILEIDSTIPDIITYNESYQVDTIAKVIVFSTRSQTVFEYFLLVDGTITTDSTDINRAKGTIETVKCTKDSEALQKATDTFRKNSYQHNITIELIKSSKIYSIEDFVIGRPLKIKTASNGIYNTFVANIDKKSNRNIYKITCGNMKITLLEKLKGVV